MIQIFFEVFTKFYPFSQNFNFSGNLDIGDSYALKKRDFHFLSKEIGSTWKRFARQFDIEDRKIVDITNHFSWDRDRCYIVFRELTVRYGSVKWKPIEMALQELGLDQIIRMYLSWKQDAHKNS